MKREMRKHCIRILTNIKHRKRICNKLILMINYKKTWMIMRMIREILLSIQVKLTLEILKKEKVKIIIEKVLVIMIKMTMNTMKRNKIKKR